MRVHGHMKRDRFLSSVILAVYLATIVSPVTQVLPAKADMIGSTDLSSTNLTSTTTSNSQTKDAAFSSCDDICADIQFVMDNGNHKIRGLNTGTSHAWNTADELLCATLELATVPGTAPTATVDPRYTASGQPCDLTITQEVLEGTYGEYGKGNKITEKTAAEYATDPGFNSVCINANKFRKQCKYHNSQVETQCLAYGSMKKGSLAQDSNFQLMMLDMGCAGLCGIACWAMNPAIDLACGAAAAAEGAYEISQSILMQDTLLGQLAGEIGGAVGGAGGVAGMGSAGQKLVRGGAVENIEAFTMADGSTVYEKNTGEQFSPSTKDEYDKSMKSKGPTRSNISCAMAGVYATLFGIRVYVKTNFEENVAKACSTVQDYASKVVLPAPTGNTTGNIRNGGGNFETGKAGSPSAQQEAAMAAACAAGSCAGLANAQSSKAEAGAMKEIPSELLQKHPLKNLDQVLDAIKKGDANGAMAAGTSGLGPLSDQLAAVAGEAKEKGAQLMGAAGIEMPATLAGYSTGGHEGRSYASSDGGGMFGGQHASGMAKPDAQQQFGKQPIKGAGNDIWHTNDDRNIFQIVSDLVGKKANTLILQKLTY